MNDTDLSSILKMSIHIAFYYIENRIQYINRIIDETNKYRQYTDIFIHTNNPYLNPSAFHTYTNGDISIVYHELKNENPFYLTWKPRKLMKAQKDDYDIFMYIEDDILVPVEAIDYWKKYNKKLIKLNYNLGFVRIETKYGVEYITDLRGTKFDTFIELEGITYCVNNKNPYCAFWIYDKTEFNQFVSSKYYDVSTNNMDYDIREKSAIGLHDYQNHWYKGTLIPITNNQLVSECRVYHMPNNYVFTNPWGYATVKFNESVKNVYSKNRRMGAFIFTKL
jgi:hypothetical protein